MKERPIIFSGPMIQAVLNGVKSQTRRVITPQPEQRTDGWHVATRPRSGYSHESTMRDLLPVYCPYGKVGDRLWCRETWSHDAPDLDTCRRGHESDGPFHGPYYKATASEFDQVSLHWRPSIHMPRWASRLTLEITDVRVERVQDISEADAEAEGAESASLISLVRGGDTVHSYREGFATLWDKINVKRPGCSWSNNNWVWVISFRRAAP